MSYLPSSTKSRPSGRVVVFSWVIETILLFVALHFLPINVREIETIGSTGWNVFWVIVCGFFLINFAWSVVKLLLGLLLVGGSAIAFAVEDRNRSSKYGFRV